MSCETIVQAGSKSILKVRALYHTSVGFNRKEKDS